MIKSTDPAAGWARRLAALRAQAARGRRGAPPADLTEDALSLCDTVIRELAGAQLTNDILRADLRTADAAWDHLFDTMPTACLMTDGASAILQANRVASGLLNVSASHLKGRDLLVYSQDREAFLTLLSQLSRNGGTELRARLMVRPRERKPTLVQLHVVPAYGREGAWLWALTPASAEAADLSLGIPADADHELTRLSDIA
jgi:PAS domain-containing protein